MKATLIITDDHGNSWECELPLGVAASRAAASGKPHKAGSKRAKPVATAGPQKPDLKLPLRAFVKKYAKGLSGSRKFTLLVAHLSAGETSADVPLSEIEKQWNKMTSLLGDFNAAYSTRAKDEGWVDSPKYGSYNLLSAWEEALSDG